MLSLFLNNKINLKISISKVYTIVGLALFALLYIHVYKNWLNANFEYMFFYYLPLNWGLFLYILILICLPCLLVPVRINRPSQIVYWILYLTVYVPSIITPFFTQFQPVYEVAKFALFLCIGNILMSLFYRLPLVNFRLKPFSEKMFNRLTLLVSFFLLFYVVYVYRGNFKFASFDEVYDVRFQSEELDKGVLVGYCVMILSGCLYPLFMSKGLLDKKPLFFFYGAFGQVILYCTAAMKGILGSIFIILILYILIRRNSVFINKMLLLLNVAILSIAVFFMQSPIAFVINSLFFLRTLGIPGLLAAEYHSFFYNHPLTHLSHVNGVNLILKYPYPYSIGQVIGNHFYDSETVNANANFWLTDGLAAFWLPGVLLSSVITALVFYLLDSFAKRKNKKLVMLALCVVALNLANASIFTTLLSGGLGFLILLVAFSPDNSIKSTNIIAS